MEIALLSTIIIGLAFAIYLSLENDWIKEEFLKTKKAEEDRIYKLSVIKDVEEKIAYTTDHEKIVDIIMVSLRNFFNYSAAASMTMKNQQIVFKVYVDDKIGQQYIKQVEENMLDSFGKFVGKLPPEIDKQFYGEPIDHVNESTYSSSFHIPLIANNQVLALIHLSSIVPNSFSNMEDLYELINVAQTALTHFAQSIDRETEKFSSLIESIKDGIFMLDNKNNLITINNSAKNILGLTDRITLPEIQTIFGHTFDLQGKIEEVMLSKNPYFAKEVQAGNKTLNIYINPADSEKVSVVLHDVSDYKKKELLKEDLIHIMVHELRAPVTTIKDSAELIITSKDTLDEDRKLKFLDMIHQQAKKVLGQIGSILDTAKLDAGKLVLQKTKGDIAKLIQDEIKTFMPQAERKNISLTLDVAAKSLPEFSFDEIRIGQVIDNLPSNSLKFTPEAGKIQVEVDYKTISPVIAGAAPMEEFLSLDKYIVVSVSDNGIGLTPDQQKLLFSKYTQAQNSSEKIATQGTGLGLYLVKGIIESHNGRIWVKSVPGLSTTFSFALPATDAAQVSYDIPRPTATPLSKLSQTVNYTFEVF